MPSRRPLLPPRSSRSADASGASAVGAGSLGQVPCSGCERRRRSEFGGAAWRNRASGRWDWTPTVHALLRHLHDVGFDGAPRPLGLEGDVEILTFVHGGEATHSDEELARVGGLIRAFHDASRSFVAPAGARWQFMVGAPREGDVICHNDLAPDNTIYEQGGLPRAFIDWDLAAPAPPLWDFASAAYRFVPLYDDRPVSGSAIRPADSRSGCESSATGTASKTAQRSWERCANGFVCCSRLPVLGRRRSPRLARSLGRHARRAVASRPPPRRGPKQRLAANPLARSLARASSRQTAARRRGNTEGTPRRARASTRGHSSGADSSGLRDLFGLRDPRLPERVRNVLTPPYRESE
jgi:Phosphotransferase enzyme family